MDKEREQLELHRVKVQTHDVNMEALVRARDEFMTAFRRAKTSADEINSKLFVKFETSHNLDSLDIIEQRKHYHG